MAEKHVVIRFNEPSEGVAGDCRLEIDDEKTLGSDPYEVDQDVWLKYFSDSLEPTTVNTTNGTAKIDARNIPFDVIDSLVFQNESEKTLTELPRENLNFEWIGDCIDVDGNVTAAPNTVFDGRKVVLSYPVSGILKVDYTACYTSIITVPDEEETALVVAQQGVLATSETYDVGPSGHRVENGNDDENPDPDDMVEEGPDDPECCKTAKPVWIWSGSTITAGSVVPVVALEGCLPMMWFVSGEGYSLVNTGRVHFSGNNAVIADSEACGPCRITVIDACGNSDSITLENASGCCGDSEIKITGAPSSLKNGDSKPISATPTKGPYTWTILDGYNVTLEETVTELPSTVINAGPNVCGPISVSVRDSCFPQGLDLVNIGAAGNGCCPDDPRVEMFEENPETAVRGGSVRLYAQYGKGPYTWTMSEISGDGFWFDQAHTLKSKVTSAPVIVVWLDSTACGSAVITVTDACNSSDSQGLREASFGQWVLNCSTDPKSPCSDARAAQVAEKITGNMKYITTWACCIEAGNQGACGNDYANDPFAGLYPPNGVCEPPWNCYYCQMMLRIVYKHKVYEWICP